MKISIMKNITCIIYVGLFLIFSCVSPQKVLLNADHLVASNVFLSDEKLEGRKALKVLIDTTIRGFDEPTFAKIKDLDFKNGVIEVKVLSRLVKNAPDWARGFIGVAFRIDANNTQFESIYIRPTNGRVEDQIRRNHSIQYFAFPDYKFERLRKESPEKYESYADMGLNEWITIRIVVQGSKARLFLGNNQQPSLIVNDLKLGEHHSGAIGLWVGNWTEGYFRDLKVVQQ
jgi:hypothetical protein